MRTIIDLKLEADNLGIQYKHNIAPKTLSNRIDKYKREEAGIEEAKEISPDEVDHRKDVDVIEREISREDELMEIMNSGKVDLKTFHEARREFIKLKNK